jgi:hypothetical protein
MLTAAALLAACGATRYTDYPPYEGVGFTDRATTEKEMLLARSDFSVELTRFADNRAPRMEADDPSDRLIYVYDPDELVSGVTYRLPVLFNKYLAYRPRMAKHYKAEIDLTALKTEIAAGRFLDGEYGRYVVRLEARVLVRRADSTAVINHPFSIFIEQRRRTYNGRSPSVEMDRSRMYDLTEDAVRQMSEEVGWEIRQMDARYLPAPRAALPVPALREIAPAPEAPRPMPLPHAVTPSAPLPLPVEASPTVG